MEYELLVLSGLLFCVFGVGLEVGYLFSNSDFLAVLFLAACFGWVGFTVGILYMEVDL
jgi:hypothetical protein